MSSLLEQAFVDAKALKEVALKNAEAALDVIDNADSPITGPGAMMLSRINPSSSAGQLASRIGALQSKTALGAMMALKEASANGSTGFGQLNRAELQILIDSMGALDPFNTDPKILRETVVNIMDKWDIVKKSIVADPKMTPEYAERLGIREFLYSTPEFASEAEAIASGHKGKAIIGGRRGRIQ